MYRSFVILVLLCFADSSVSSFHRESKSPECQGITGKYCRPSSPRNYKLPHPNYRGNGQNTATEAPPDNVTPTPAPVNTFEDLAKNLIAAELAIQKYCLENSIANVRETYGIVFELTYYVQNAKVNEVAVQIKHRVIYVTVKKVGVTIYKDLRILPNIVDAKLATWRIENGNIKVTIPYSESNTNLTENCNNVNDTLIDVPKSTITVEDGKYREDGNEEGIKISEENIVRIFGSPDGAGMIDIRFRDN